MMNLCSMTSFEGGGFELSIRVDTVGEIVNTIREPIDTVNIVTTGENNPISEITIIKKQGITSFSDKNLNCTWKLSENE